MTMMWIRHGLNRLKYYNAQARAGKTLKRKQTWKKPHAKW